MRAPRAIARGLGAVALLAGAAGLVACAERYVGPVEPAGHVPFDAPARYQAWWEAVEACTGVAGNFAAIEWRTVPDAALFAFEGKYANGLWLSRGNRIIVAEAAQLDGAVVRHEMLHALLREPGHPRTAFIDRCGGVVTCSESCREEAGAGAAHLDGPPYDRSIRVADWSEFQLTLVVRPGRVSLGSGSRGWSTITVAARNPLLTAVYARVPEHRTLLGRGKGEAFGWRGGGLPGGLQPGDTLLLFEPGETRRELFDLDLESLARTGTVSLGDHAVAGLFAGRLFGSAGLSLQP